MKKNGSYTALICVLAFSLQFNQVALNFFHNRHDAHKSYQTQSNDAQFHAHGDHCKVCSLETLFHLYFEATPDFGFQLPEETIVSVPVLATVIAHENFIRGRAPPFLS